MPPNDRHALAARMRILWTDAERRRATATRCCERAREHHPEERYTRRLLDLYERVRSSRYWRANASTKRGLE